MTKQQLPADGQLDTWLRWLEALHPVAIDLGIERVARVADRCKLRPAPMPVIIVGGTNGKGSTVEMLSNIYSAAGFQTGAYTSPHINVFNERIRVNGKMAGDTEIVAALGSIEQRRPPETLTYFEYTTLAAMQLFIDQACDVVILEVGLGGRLDAANIWDADCAIVTSIAIDHEDWLGSDRNVIATEKAAIGRSGRPLIVGEPNPPQSLIDMAESCGMQLHLINSTTAKTGNLLPGDHQQRNAACASAAVEQLQSRLPVTTDHMESALRNTHLAGRFERLTVGGIPVILDVAHNPAAAMMLRDTLQKEYPGAIVHAVFSVLADKDIDGIIDAFKPVVHNWYCAALDVPRAQAVDELQQRVLGAVDGDDTKQSVKAFASVALAWQSAANACEADMSRESKQTSLVLVAGSFYTLSALHAYWQT